MECVESEMSPQRHLPEPSIILDIENFCLWEHYVEEFVAEHGYEDFIKQNPNNVPPKLDADGNETKEYREWCLKDSIIFCWLLSSLNDEIGHYLGRLKHAWQLFHFVKVHNQRPKQVFLRQQSSKVQEIMKMCQSCIEYYRTLIKELDDTNCSLPEEQRSFLVSNYSLFNEMKDTHDSYLNQTKVFYNYFLKKQKDSYYSQLKDMVEDS